MSNGYIYIWKRVFVFVCVYVSPGGSTGLLDFLLLFVHATTFRHLRLIRSLCGFFIHFWHFLPLPLSLFYLSVSVFIHPRISLDASLPLGRACLCDLHKLVFAYVLWFPCFQCASHLIYRLSGGRKTSSNGYQSVLSSMCIDCLIIHSGQTRPPTRLRISSCLFKIRPL